MREVNKNIITVVVSGKFLDINSRKLNYRVQIALPNCMDEWLLSNILNRYLMETLRNCKEYTEKGELVDNNDYGLVNSIESAIIETNDRHGNSLIIDTGKIPTFYGKSIFDLSYMEIQDVATALGLHEISIYETLEDLQKNTVIAYLKRIKKLTDQQIKEMSFYRYDKIRMKYYIEFSNFDKERAIINDYNCADLEEFIEEEERFNGYRSMSELFDAPETTNKKKPITNTTNNKKDLANVMGNITTI